MVNWTVPALIDRGWRIHEKHTNSTSQVLMLCPLVELNNVPDGTIFWHISGQMAVKGRDHLDTKTQAGVLGYGVWVGNG